MVPQNLQESIDDILENTPKYEKPHDIKALQNFIDLINLYEDFFGTRVEQTEIEYSILDSKSLL